ncbi:hypothetical protein STHU_04190 [Allostella humosa]|nr:hypothetical protein STHU_04190 [Stella humosa]
MVVARAMPLGSLGSLFSASASHSAKRRVGSAALISSMMLPGQNLCEDMVFLHFFHPGDPGWDKVPYPSEMAKDSCWTDKA